MLAEEAIRLAAEVIHLAGEAICVRYKNNTSVHYFRSAAGQSTHLARRKISVMSMVA